MKQNNFIKFLGTAGARFVTISQLRASGGIWIRYQNTNILIDPGPGSLVKALEARPKLLPKTLDAIILTHRHLDHASDLNIMTEAMTEGCRNKRGMLLVPEDSLKKETMILSFLRKSVKSVKLLNVKKSFVIKDIRLQNVYRLRHSVETYALKFIFGKTSLCLVSDTMFFPSLSKKINSCDYLILNVVFYKPNADIKHLDYFSAIKLIKEVKPKRAIITHFGTPMLKANPKKLAKKAKKMTGIDVLAAEDGMKLMIK
ncbi:MAG: MBL fold metallo-hydrolase [Candidatus Gygaella obscura]|nr:MBL fold metallo-hydrolase [Candidatus Gygaella obscura]